MNKLKMHTPDGIKDNIARIAELFPNCVIEAKDETGNVTRVLDFDQLRQELSNQVLDGPRERFHLDWPGKRESLIVANAPIAKTLRPSRKESVEFDSTRNLYIEGDNLEVLKMLQETYLNCVKFIYIDPPYNTGGDFLYEDDFSANPTEYLVRSNQRDAVGNRLLLNAESNGRFHSDWLSMMAPRLKLARNLLRDDGVILISIDDIEVAKLRLLCDEIFGTDNFIAEMVWEGATKNDARQIGVCHEYVVIYAKNRVLVPREWSIKKEGVEPVLAEVERLQQEHGEDYDRASSELAGWFRAMKAEPAFANRRFRNIDSRGAYREDDPTAPGGRRFDLRNPRTGAIIRLRQNRGWGFDQAEFERLDQDGRIVYVSETSIMVKRYLHETDRATPQSVFYQPTRSASERLARLLGGMFFEFPKDELILQKLIDMATDPADPDCIVMDFFAGSSSTSHAVFLLNASDGGKRRHIAVQLPEPVAEESAAYKEGYTTIANLGKERIRRAGKAIQQEAGLSGSTLDVGFRVLKVDTSNMKDVYYQPDAVQQETLHGLVDNVKEDRADEDLLFQVLLDWGVDLTLPIKSEKVKGKTVYFVDTDALAACFEPGINEAFIKELAQRKPLRAVFRDGGYGSDATKINVEQIFKLLSPGTEVKSI